MKCLTLHAHWAEAIFALDKNVENRMWATRYRGPLAIHAGAKIDDSICEMLGLQPRTLRVGAILGVVDLLDCVRDFESPWAMPGHYHWLLTNPRRCTEPIAFKGRRKLFSVDEEIAQLLARSLGSEQSLGLTPLH
jgi:hypothetical protein